MKKIITPIFHVMFMIPMTGIMVGVEMIARETGILGEYKGIIDLPTTITFLLGIPIFGIPVFWLANILMQKIEKLQSPKIYDFMRQSIFYFVVFIGCASTWIAHGCGGTEEDGYLLLWSGISLIAVVINYIFLFRKR
jgi:cytochrome bd-type quinol oxidase subunit 2